MDIIRYIQLIAVVSHNFNRYWPKPYGKYRKLFNLVLFSLGKNRILQEWNGTLISYSLPLAAVLYPSGVRLGCVIILWMKKVIRNFSIIVHAFLIMSGLAIFFATINDASRGKHLVITKPIEKEYVSNSKLEISSVYNIGSNITTDSKFYKILDRLNDLQKIRRNLPSAHGDVIYEWISCPSNAKPKLLETRTKDFGEDDYWIPQLEVHAVRYKHMPFSTFVEFDMEYCFYTQYDKPKLLSINIFNPVTEMFCVQYQTYNLSSSSTEISRLINATVDMTTKIVLTDHLTKASKFVVYSAGSTYLIYNYIGPSMYIASQQAWSYLNSPLTDETTRRDMEYDIVPISDDIILYNQQRESDIGETIHMMTSWMIRSITHILHIFDPFDN